MTSINSIDTSFPLVIASIILLIASCLDVGSISFSLALSYATSPPFFAIDDLILKIQDLNINFIIYLCFYIIPTKYVYELIKFFSFKLILK